MKKFTTLSLCLLATLGIVRAEEWGFTDNQGVNYILNTTTKTGAVTTSDPSQVDIVIPSILSAAPEENQTPENYTITSILDYAFNDCYGLQTISLPNSIVSIGMESFKGCGSLESISLPNSITSIGESAFYYCSSLKNISLPGSIKSIENYTFEGCSSLETIELPATLEFLGAAFGNCSSLKSVKIPEGITELLPFTFSNCYSLVSITIPKSLKVIGPAFEGCSEFSIIDVPDIETWCAMTWLDDFKPFRNGMHLYLNGEEVVNLVIPSSVKAINNEVFSDFNWIKTVDISGFVNSIGAQAFTGCLGLESVKIDPGVESMGDYAFAYCDNLTSVSLPSDLTDIGIYAFCYCTSLESIELPNSLEVISEGLMRGCESLSSLTIPDNVSHIGDSAFSRCDNLATVYFPANLKSIGSWSFEESGIKNAYCEAITPPTCAGGAYASFNQTNLLNSTLHVPLGTKAAYASAGQWSRFGTIIDGSEGDGVEILESDIEKRFDIMDLSGRVVKRNATIDDLNSLDNDIYIINGEKTIINR